MTEERVETATEVLTKVDTASQLDAKGRLITVKQLNALQLYRLGKALGAASSTNPATMEMAQLACTVIKIDAERVAFPATEREVEFLIQQLDFEGIVAAAEALKKLVGEGNAETELESAKN